MKKLLICGQYMQGLKKAFEAFEYEIYDTPSSENMNEIEKTVKEVLPTHLFTYNFFPQIAIFCEKRALKYISWVVDWPHSAIFSIYAKTNNNYIFIFDRSGCEDAIRRGMNNVYYLPLAADIEEFEKTINSATDEMKAKYESQVSFMGNLYDAPEHNLYERVEYIPPLVKGYLEGIMAAQKKVWGYTFVKEAIRKEIWTEIRKNITWDLGDKYDPSVYEELIEKILCEKIAQDERKEMCNILAERYPFVLYTKSCTGYNSKIDNRGPLHYFDEMPLAFNRSKININITLRSIKSGIPLRCLDILACGGFLMTNYQQELAEFFADGEEVVIWNDFEDLIYKIGYYLEHEEERKKIAEAGQRRVKQIFNYKTLVSEIISVVDGEKEL